MSSKRLHEIEKKNRKKGMSGHLSGLNYSDIWLTPPWILDALGSFELDPCTFKEHPWMIGTKKNYFESDDGTKKSWEGMTAYVNPPYSVVTPFLKKAAEHQNSIVLIFARTETKNWINHVWPHASAILFIYGRLYFHHPDGRKASSNAGAPSCLIAYGKEMRERLKQANLNGIKGKFVELNDHLFETQGTLEFPEDDNQISIFDQIRDQEKN